MSPALWMVIPPSPAVASIWRLFVAVSVPMERLPFAESIAALTALPLSVSLNLNLRPASNNISWPVSRILSCNNPVVEDIVAMSWVKVRLPPIFTNGVSVSTINKSVPSFFSTKNAEVELPLSDFTCRSPLTISS